MTRLVKTLHGWLGVLILPWIVLAGLTGLAENHGAAILGLLPQVRFTAAMLEGLPPQPVDPDRATALAQELVGAPGAAPAQLLNRPAFQAATPERTVQIDQATGAYLVIGPYASTLYTAEGHRLARQVQWGRLLHRLHRAGWASNRFGTWPADLAAGALMVFGLSGLWLFFAPRLRRWRNRPMRRA